jgi:DNA-binding transcriptional MerR regulator
MARSSKFLARKHKTCREKHLNRMPPSGVEQITSAPVDHPDRHVRPTNATTQQAMTPEQDGPETRERGSVVMFGDRGETVIADDVPLTIGNVARMLGVSRLRLWRYEIRGLIRRRRGLGRSRVYRWEDSARVAFLIRAREVGLSVRELAPVVKATDSAAPVEAVSRARRTCLGLIDRLDRRRQRCATCWRR